MRLARLGLVAGCALIEACVCQSAAIDGGTCSSPPQCAAPICGPGNRCANGARCFPAECPLVTCDGGFAGGWCICPNCDTVSGSDEEGSPCTTLWSCAGDSECVANICQLPCYEPSHCSPGQMCAGGYCSPIPAYGFCSFSDGGDQLMIGRRDPITGLCVVIHVGAPNGSQLDISGPGQWRVLSANASFPDGGCPGPMPGPGPGVIASSGTGRIDFDAGMAIPDEVAVHATLTFPPDSGVPTTVELNASGITQCR